MQKPQLKKLVRFVLSLEELRDNLSTKAEADDPETDPSNWSDIELSARAVVTAFDETELAKEE